MTVEEIAKMMDVSAVQVQSTREDIDACYALAAEYGCAAVFCFASLSGSGMAKVALGAGSPRQPFCSLGIVQ